MIDAMWIWGAVGLVLLALEMATGTFYILWFGVAGVILAIATGLFPQISQPVQIAIYAALSLGSLAIWKFYYKKNETHPLVGQAQGEEIGCIGTVIEAVGAKQNGKIRFAQGVMGSKEWAAISAESIEVGTEAVVIALEGNTLRIKQYRA